MRAAPRRPAGLSVHALTAPAYVGVAALTGVAAGLRFYGLARQGFWFDEGNTVLLVHFSPGRMLGLIPQSESTPPLYYLVAWVWARCFGFGEAGLRSLSALAGALVVPIAYGAAAKLVSRRAGIIAAALTACSPLLIWYSQEARSYEVMVLLTGVALLAFAYALHSSSARILAAWALASVLALATHYYGLLAILPEAIWLLHVHGRRRSAQLAVGGVALCAVALIPLAISQSSTGNSNWIASVSLLTRLRQIAPLFLIGTGAPAQGVLEPLAAALAVAALTLLGWRGRAGERSGALLAGGLATAGLVVSLLLVAAGVDELIARNLIALWLPATVLVAGGLAVRRAGAVGIAITIGLCVIGVTASVGVAADPSLQRPDWRPVARALGPLPAGSPGRAILVQRYLDLLPLSLYVPHLHFLGRAGARVDQLVVISIRSPPRSFCWWGAACNLIPSEMQRAYPVAGFHVVSRERVEQFTILRLESARPLRLRPPAVAAALTATDLRHDGLLIQRP